MKIEFNGENERFLKSNANRKLLVGPACSGKTYTAMMLIHLTCVKYPGTKVLMARKSLPALRNSCFKTYLQVLGDTNFSNVRILGETRPTAVIYKTSINEVDGKIYSGTSTITLSQIDSHAKAIGGEYDVIFINHPEAEGLTLDEFLLCISRARANNSSHRQIIAEGNLPIEKPGEKTHWLWTLPDYGFEVFNPTIKDNPLVYGFTDFGKEYLNQCESLSENYKEQILEEVWI